MAIKWDKEEPLAYELVRLLQDVQKKQAAEKHGKPSPQAAARPAPPPGPKPPGKSSLKLARGPASQGTFITVTKETPKPDLAPVKRRRERRSDLMVAAVGVTLGLICALFPWYIFFNQDEFGPPQVKFEGTGTNTSGPVALSPQPERVGAPMSIENPPELELDLFATGTLPSAQERNGSSARTALEQPFPAEEPVFRVIHVENGRAMVEDDGGMWVVQRGSSLPDNSRVASIEERDGRWVVVTSSDKVIEVTP